MRIPTALSIRGENVNDGKVNPWKEFINQGIVTKKRKQGFKTKIIQKYGQLYMCVCMHVYIHIYLIG